MIKLFVTDAECAERMGLPTDKFKAALPALNQSGFPEPDPLFENRRYWPAVRAWLDRRYGLGDQSGGITSPAGLDGQETWT